MRERTLLVAIIIAMTAAWASPALGATRDSSAEQLSLQRVNEERTARGRSSLRLHNRMTSIARQHSARMAADGELRHNDDLPAYVGPFRALGENVGYGASAEDVHAAFMGSSSHRHTILAGKYTHVGIGVVRDGEIVWITQVFYTPEDSAPRQQGESVTRAPTVRRTQAPAAARPVVRAQSGKTVRPLGDHAHRRPRQPRITRTLAMLEVMTAIDEQVARRRFVASPPVWA